MTIEFTNDSGEVKISTEVITDVVGVAAMESYGIVGMASTKRLKDGVAELLKRENYGKGIEVTKDENGEISITLHIIVLYGIKIQEVAKSVQKKTKYSIEQMLGLQVNTVNVIVEGVKISEDQIHAKKTKEE